MALFDSDNTTGDTSTDYSGFADVSTQAPADFLVAADTHNYGNGNQSMLESASSHISNAPKFLTVSLVSGVQSIYNTGVALTNWFGADNEYASTYSYLRDIDTGLADYYSQNKDSADMVGLALTSIIPGTAGIKLLNAGQKVLRGGIESGVFGENMGRALGLLTPQREQLVASASEALTNSSNSFKLLQADSIKAIGAGTFQSFLEGAAFETAVQTTMAQNPILQQQDFEDILKNVAVGGALNAVIGGSLLAAKSIYKVAAARDAADEFAKPWEAITGTPEGATPAQRIIQHVSDLENIPPLPTEYPEGMPNIAIRLQKSADAKEVRLNNLINAAGRELVGGDNTVGDMLYAGIKQLDDVTTTNNLVGLVDAGRMGTKLSVESVEQSLAKKIASDTATPEEIEQFKNQQVAYLRVTGENSGTITSDAPTTKYLADNIKKGQELEFSGNTVRIVDAVTGSTLRTVARFNPEKTIPISTAAADTTTDKLLQLDARYISSIESPTAIPAGTTIHLDDIPLMEKLYSNDTPLDSVKLVTTVGKKTVAIDSPTNKSDLLQLIKQSKDDLAAEFISKDKLSKEQIAQVLNVRGSYLNGETSANLADDLFARQYYAKQYTQELVDAGLRDEAKGLVKTYLQPTTVKLGYDKTTMGGLSNPEVAGIARIKEEFALKQQAVDNAVNLATGPEIASQLPRLPDEMLLKANRGGAGGGFFSFANGAYGSLASAMEYIGNITNRIIRNSHAEVAAELNPLLINLANKPDAALKLSTLFAKVRSIPAPYVLNEDGDALVLRALKRHADDAGVGIEEVEDVDARLAQYPAQIPIDPDIADIVAAHIEHNGTRITTMQNVRASQGIPYAKDPEVFYPPPVNPKDYPYYAFVIDPTITSTGHSKMLYAANEDALKGMIDNVNKNNPELRVLTGPDAEEFYKANGTYSYANTLHDNYIDTALARSGVSTPYYIPTDPLKITRDLLDWHLNEESYVARSLIDAKYSAQFDHLRKLGANFSNVAESKLGGAGGKFAEGAIKNPYTDFIKTALNTSKASEYPIYNAINNTVEKAVATVMDKVHSVFDTVKQPADLDAINNHLQEAGINSAYYDAATNAWANHQAAGRPLSAFIRQSNSIISALTLGLDPINGLNNFIGSNVLRSTELSSVLRAIGRGDANTAGKLVDLTTIKLPGTGDPVPSAGKLISNAFSNFWKDDGTLLKQYSDQGFNTTILQQIKSVVDELTLNGSENEVALQGKISRALSIVNGKLAAAGQTGYRVSGNQFFEQLNRFISADTMRQLTSIAVDAGKMEQAEALTYINTFVNRVEGNYLAAQRPMVFQGPIGQAIGLFQTYQFNLMQQMLRYVGEGSAKDVAMLLGLQGTIYGANGLPAFNAINQHIVGTASGNINHTDLYSATYGAAGKEAGDWLLYGLASNLLLDPNLKMNLYTRGDINPRQLSVIPVEPSQVPIVNTFGKFFGALKDTVSKIQNGGDVWNSVLQGVEHGSINRPLAGLAQVLEATGNPNMQSYSTSNKGSIIASNDFLSLANFGRVAGAKPLDEAVAIDGAFRMTAYGLADQEKRNDLGAAIKSTVIAGNMPSTEDINSFAAKYTAAGGQQTEFNKWFMGLYKSANTSQINVIANNLRNPTAQNLQLVMGGYDLKDFTNDTYSTQ